MKINFLYMLKRLKNETSSIKIFLFNIIYNLDETR